MAKQASQFVNVKIRSVLGMYVPGAAGRPVLSAEFF